MDNLFGVHEKLVSLHGYGITKKREVLTGPSMLPGMTSWPAGGLPPATSPALIATEDISDAEVRSEKQICRVAGPANISSVVRLPNELLSNTRVILH